MAELSQITVIDGDATQAESGTVAGFRATLRALVGRGPTRPSIYARSGGTFPSALSRYGMGMGYALEGLLPHDEPAPAETAVELPPRATAEDNHAALLRANAHAAYASAQGSPEAALDVALDVIESDRRALLDRAEAQAEMLKNIRLYARDPEIRALATRGLEDHAGVLACRRSVEAGCPRRDTFNT